MKSKISRYSYRGDGIIFVLGILAMVALIVVVATLKTSPPALGNGYVTLKDGDAPRSVAYPDTQKFKVIEKSGFDESCGMREMLCAPVGEVQASNSQAVVFSTSRTDPGETITAVRRMTLTKAGAQTIWFEVIPPPASKH